MAVSPFFMRVARPAAFLPQHGSCIAVAFVAATTLPAKHSADLVTRTTDPGEGHGTPPTRRRLGPVSHPLSVCRSGVQAVDQDA